MRHAVVSIAGSDPSGGAGIQADIKTITAHGGYAMAAVTSLTAQNTQGVWSVHVPPAAFLRDQLQALAEDARIDAVKIGMLATAEVVAVVADWISEFRPPYVVLDPVMVSRSGHRLLDPGAVQALRTRLVPLADLVTPNLPELADLLARPEATTWQAALEQGRALALSCGARVLVKGGHLGGVDSPDALVELDGTIQVLDGVRVATDNTHGTGCTLSSAIATLRPARSSWLQATTAAKEWLSGAIVAADALQVGKGHGPVDHLYALRSVDRPPLVPRFTDEVWAATSGLRRQIDDLPFLRGLADGTLPQPVFEEYLRQDALYLQQYARAMAALSATAPTSAEQQLWARSVDDALVVERSLHEEWVGAPAAAAALGGPPVASATCTAYTAYLLSVAQRGDYGELVAAVLPCFWVYADVGERLLARTAGQPDHPYRRWIDLYGDPDFAARCQQVRDLADRVAATGGADLRRRMTQAFATATRYEWMFWNSPWQGEHWPV